MAKRTADQVQESVDFCEDCLLKGYRPSETKAAFRKKFGDFSHSLILRYVARAREEINRLNPESLEVKRARAVKELQMVFKRSSAPWSVRIRALEIKARIEGTFAPTQITGAEGAPLIPPSQTNVVIYIPERRKLPERNAKGNESSNGHSISDGDSTAADAGEVPRITG